MSDRDPPPGAMASQPVLDTQRIEDHEPMYKPKPLHDHNGATAIDQKQVESPVLPPQVVGEDEPRHLPLQTLDSRVPKYRSQQGMGIGPEQGQALLFPSELFAANPPHYRQDSSLPGATRAYIPDDDLFRATSGVSVHDHESVIGESGRLYHGYKAGKYYLPNDAV
jgi:hypothetical protein